MLVSKAGGVAASESEEIFSRPLSDTSPQNTLLSCSALLSAPRFRHPADIPETILFRFYILRSSFSFKRKKRAERRERERAAEEGKAPSPTLFLLSSLFSLLLLPSFSSFPGRRRRRRPAHALALPQAVHVSPQDGAVRLDEAGVVLGGDLFFREKERRERKRRERVRASKRERKKNRDRKTLPLTVVVIFFLPSEALTRQTLCAACWGVGGEGIGIWEGKDEKEGEAREREKRGRKCRFSPFLHSLSSFPLSLLSPHTYRVRLSRVPALEICCGRELRF